METSKSKAGNEYKAAHYDRIGLLVPKGKKEIIRICAEGHGLTINGLINRLIDEQLEQDGYGAEPRLRDPADPKRGGNR